MTNLEDAPAFPPKEKTKRMEHRNKRVAVSSDFDFVGWEQLCALLIAETLILYYLDAFPKQKVGPGGGLGRGTKGGSLIY